MISKETENQLDMTVINDKHKLRLLEENKKNHMSVPNLNRDYESVNEDAELAQRDRSKSIDVMQISLLDPIEIRIASIMSLGNVGADAIVTEARERIENGKWYSSRNDCFDKSIDSRVQIDISINVCSGSFLQAKTGQFPRFESLEGFDIC